MKTIIIFIIILQLKNYFFSIVPTWNFENSAINLFSNSNEHSYAICDRYMYTMSLKLQKIFTKEENNITQKNILYIDNNEIGEVLWEDIESFYNINNINYICPKGKNILTIYNPTQNNFKEIWPDDFNIEENDWDLQCYYQENEKKMFVAFINKHQIIYPLNVDDNTWGTKIEYFNDGLYDFKWVTDPINNNEYPMKALVLKDNFLTLKSILFTLNGEITVEEKKEKKFNDVKISTYSQSYFNLNNSHFYFMTYNTINDFYSGYYNESKEISFDGIEDIEPIVNTISSPLEFLEDFDIEYINFIRNTKYLYYKIINNDKNITYHGIIDIESNKVIFNTDKKIIEFKPYSDNSMLAITNESAYKICIIKGDNNECLNECSNNHIFYDILKPNHCFNEGDKCDNYVLMPNDICIEECDENIFHKNDNNECGLCRDLYDERPYKMINSKGCISENEKPTNNFIIINQKLGLISCEQNYTFSEGECISICNDLCKTCDIYSEDINDQKCTSCKNENHVLQDGNCIEECNEGYYEEEKKCLKCSDFCKICQNSSICTDCYDGYFLDENKCKKCSDNCETCSKGPEENGNQNCISCNQNTSNKYLINDEKNHTCVEECPQSTYLDEENKTCEKCSDFCKKCENSEKCLDCNDGYYLDDNKCKKCSDNCQTCSKGPQDDGNQNCKTCNQESPYKYLINDESNHTCVENCPENTYLDEEKKQCLKCSEFCEKCENGKCLKCFDGYYLDDNICKKCSDNCETCFKGPEENGNQNCITCNQNSNNKYLINDENNHTCVNNCPENTYLDNNHKICEKCIEFCKFCLKSDKCEICYDGYYLKEKICMNCSDNCETCSKGPGENGNQNCLKCNQSSSFKYLINDEDNRTCVEQCPTNTYLETKNQTCIKTKNKSKNSNNVTKNNYFWIIIVILIIILLLIIILCIYKKNKKQITSEDIERAFDKNTTIH